MRDETDESKAHRLFFSFSFLLYMDDSWLKFTRHTLNCVLMACSSLADYPQAIERFYAHVADGGEVGIDTFNLLFKAGETPSTLWPFPPRS